MSSALLDPDIQAFIFAHENDNVATLALKKPPHPDWPYTLILDQIKARQKAKVKIPQWLGHTPILLPSADTMEQASSAATALYKASLFNGKDKSFIDLTAGAGIDSWAFAQNFKTGISIDQNYEAATRLKHNFETLGINHVSVKNEDATNIVNTIESIDLAVIDPQRRDNKQSKKGMFKFEECSPNIHALLPILQNKAGAILIKCSTILDIGQAIEDLPNINAIHIVEWHGECKEILILIKPNNNLAKQIIPITAVSINDQGQAIKLLTFTHEEEKNTQAPLSAPLQYLYEPSPAFMKAGGFKILATRYALSKLHPHTHLYTSNTQCDTFPGRIFEVKALYPVQAKSLPFKKANLSIRNFPQNIETLKKKLKLKDGGKDYLFACTLMNENSTKAHTLIHCIKPD